MSNPSAEREKVDVTPAAGDERGRLPWEEPTLRQLSLSRAEHNVGGGVDGGGVEAVPS